MTYEFKLGNQRYFAIELYDSKSFNFKINEKQEYLYYDFPSTMGFNKTGSGSLHLPFWTRQKYRMKIVGQFSKLSEKECQAFIPRSNFPEHRSVFYTNYMGLTNDAAYVFVLAKRSLESLLQKHGADTKKDYIIIKKIDI